MTISMRFIAFTLLLALAGCLSTGNRVETNRLTEITKGKSTIDDVISHFGQPTSSVKYANGEQTLVYLNKIAQPDAATFIPLIGTFVGSVNNTTHSVIFEFDAKGVLTDYEVHDATVNSESGQQIPPK
jgi:hypothetical protein